MPGVIALIMAFSKQTKMAELYGIRDNEMGYYLAFACVIIPFSLIMDVFVLNTQEVCFQLPTISLRPTLILQPHGLWHVIWINRLCFPRPVFILSLMDYGG